MGKPNVWAQAAAEKLSAYRSVGRYLGSIIPCVFLLSFCFQCFVFKPQWWIELFLKKTLASAEAEKQALVCANICGLIGSWRLSQQRRQGKSSQRRHYVTAVGGLFIGLLGCA